MLPSPFLKIGSAVVLGLLGSTVQANADAPAVVTPPLTGGAVYVRESTIHTTLRPALRGPLLGATPVEGGAPGQRPPFVMPPAVVLPKPKPEDAKKLLEVVSLEKANRASLDLTVEKASLEEIVAQIKRTLGEKAPRIEVHDALPIRLSFAIKDSTLGEVLETTGGLAGVKLWVLRDHLLLAPQTALTEDEASGAGGTSVNDMQRVFASLLADELAAKSGVKGTTVGTGTGTLGSAKTTFNELSPEGKEMLQGLVEKMNEINRTRADAFPDGTLSGLHSPVTLTPDTVVELNGSRNMSGRNGTPIDTVSITQENRGMRWATDGNSWGSSYSAPRPPQNAPAPTAPPLFDPSAKKS